MGLGSWPSVGSINRPAYVQSQGTKLAEVKTESDADEGVVTFQAPFDYVLILNRDGDNDGVFTVNGLDIPVPKGQGYHMGVLGTPDEEVTVTGSTSYIIQRLI